MPNTWVYSDPHFYHRNIVKFTTGTGEPLRPWDDYHKMTNDMIDMYNDLVKDEDRVYILGDVAFSATNMRESVGRLKGRKVLVKGNHDPDKHRQMYMELFDDVRAYVIKKGFIMSHIPIHPQSLSRWNYNIHGHLHANVVLLDDGTPDTRYINACVEHHDFKPVLLSKILPNPQHET